jgi:hypothetical protein
MGWQTELLDALKDVLTEENTDMVLEYIFDKIDVPMVPDDLVKNVLDAVMPMLLLEALESVLVEQADDGAGS